MADSASLRAYHQKRNFTRTKEPRGKLRRRTGDLFVVHKHDARRLHYDLRLELDGVLKSWAVTRVPSLSPADKRLAVRTEDHPLDYGEFEGKIPEGEYGAGSVIVWDRGRWSTEGDPHQQLAKGHLEFELDGTELTARCMLHETDHCDGIVFLDRMSPLKREIVKRKIRKAQKAGDWPS